MHLKTISADDSISHVALIGRLDVKGVTDIQYEFLQETTVLPKPTLVDLSRVTYMASFGISMLVSAAKHLQRNGAKMVLLCPSSLVRSALETSGLHDVIPITDDKTAALALLR